MESYWTDCHSLHVGDSFNTTECLFHLFLKQKKWWWRVILWRSDLSDKSNDVGIVFVDQELAPGSCVGTLPVWIVLSITSKRVFTTRRWNILLPYIVLWNNEPRRGGRVDRPKSMMFLFDTGGNVVFENSRKHLLGQFVYFFWSLSLEAPTFVRYSSTSRGMISSCWNNDEQRTKLRLNALVSVPSGQCHKKRKLRVWILWSWKLYRFLIHRFDSSTDVSVLILLWDTLDGVSLILVALTFYPFF